MSHGSEKRDRFRHLTIRLNLAERAAIDYAAERAGLTAGSYARNTLLGAPMPRQMRRRAVDGPALARVLGELGKIGGNLNQLAKASNSGVLLYAGEIAPAALAILEMRDAVMAALGHEP
jgi:Bacterial mobilisation protein (MobC)